MGEKARKGAMMRTAVPTLLLGGFLYLLAKKLSDGGQPAPTLPPVRREHADRLKILLEQALSYGNKPMWDEVSEECRRIGRPDLPGHVRDAFPPLAESFDRLNPSE